MWAIEREQAGIQLFKGTITLGTRHFTTQHGDRSFGIDHLERAFADLERTLHNAIEFRTGLAGLADYHINRVFFKAGELLESFHRLEITIDIEFRKSPGAPPSRRPPYEKPFRALITGAMTLTALRRASRAI